MEQLGQAAAKLLDNLLEAAKVIGAQGERLWPQLVMITFVKSLFWVIAYPLISIILFLTGFHYAKRLWRYYGVEEQKADRDGGIAVIFGFLTILLMGPGVGFLIAMLVNMPNDLAGVVAPEARTVIELAQQLGSVVKGTK